MVRRKLDDLINQLDAEVEFYREHDGELILQHINGQGRRDRIIELIEDVLNHRDSDDETYRIGVSPKATDLLLDLMRLNDMGQLKIV